MTNRENLSPDEIFMFAGRHGIEAENAALIGFARDVESHSAQDVAPVMPSDWAPDRIYLQREQGEGGSHTWCEDSVGDGDIIEEAEYVRVGAPDVARAPELDEGMIIAAVQKACGEYRTNASYSFEDVWNCIEAAFALAAPAAPAVAPVPTPQQISDYLHGLDRIQRELVEREARLLLPTAEPEPAKISAPDIILTGAQLIEALDFIAPDRDADQLESEVAFAYGEGHSGKAMYIWCAEYPEEGSLVCDGSSATAAPAQAEQPDPIIAAKDVLLAAIQAGGPKAHFAAGEVFRLADLARKLGMHPHGSMLDALKEEQQRDGGEIDCDAVVSICDAHGIGLPVDCIEMVVEIVRHALPRPSERPSARVALSDALNEYERQTKALPCQHEVPERGCCSYNWRMACVRDIRTILADNAAPLTDASRDVLTERRRQIEQEGWTPEYDDEHHNAGALASAATAYALAAADKLDPLSQGDGQYDNCPPIMWPFAPKWWKPSTPRRDLVKAGALILAEIERTDRETATSNNEVSR